MVTSQKTSQSTKFQAATLPAANGQKFNKLAVIFLQYKNASKNFYDSSPEGPSYFKQIVITLLSKKK